MDATTWVNVTNAALGVAVLACCLFVLVGLVPAVFDRIAEVRAQRRLSRPVGHSTRVKLAWRELLPQQRLLW